MPLPRWVARANRVAANPVLLPLSGRLRHFATVVHRGRVTGFVYRTPVNVFESDGAFVVPLTYGAGSDWVRNVLAAGGCMLVHRGGEVAVTEPVFLTEEEALQAIPAPVRLALTFANVHDFLELSRRAA